MPRPLRVLMQKTALGVPALALAATLGCNQPPTGPEIALDPAAPTSFDDLTVVFTSEAADPNNDTLSIGYEWAVRRVDGPADFTVRDDISGSVLPSAMTEKGQVWQVTVTVSDGKETAPESATAEVEILNSPPTVSFVRMTPTTGVDTFGTLTATAGGEDLDGESVDIDLVWYVDGVALDVDSNVLTGEYFTKGQEVRVEAVANDGEDSSEPVASTAAVIENSPPKAEAAVVGPEERFEESTLTCTLVGWYDADGDEASADVAWYVNGDEVATGATLDGSYFGRDDLVRCRATPNDGDDVGPSVVSEVVAISNTAPTLGGVTIDNPEPKAIEEVTFSVSDAADIDGDEVTYLAEWYVDGELVFAGDVLPAGSHAKGQQITVVVTPSDGELTGEPVTSDAVTVGNTPPELVSISLVPDPLYTDDVLFPSVEAVDADGERISYTQTWYVNGSAVGETGATLDGADWFSKGDEVYVEITPTDGDDAGTPMTSATVTVLNSAPTVPDLAIDPAEPGPDEDLWCYLDAEPTDADGDTIEVTVSWTQNGTAFTGADTLEYDGDYVYADDTVDFDDWLCSVTISDGTETFELEALAEVRSWRGPRVFTNCGKSGYIGPSESDCTATYAGTPLAGDTFAVSDGIQEWVVPTTGTYRIEAYGAQGGAGYYGYYSGYEGARVRGDFDLTEGDILYILVGQEGTNYSYGYSGSGGGGTFVVDEAGDPMLVAGGGGGNGYSYTKYSGCYGNGGSLYGNGASGSYSSCYRYTATAPDGGAYYYSGSSYSGFGGAGFSGDGGATVYTSWKAYSFENGGRGGNSYYVDGGFGGGGGTGYYYGGGGGGGYHGGGGSRYQGGGGSSYNTGSNPSSSDGANSSHGKVSIDLVVD